MSNISVFRNPKSPKAKDLTRRPRSRLRPVTAPIGRSATNRANVRRTLLFTDTRAFGPAVWEINVWDATGGCVMKDVPKILRVTAEHTTTGQKCGTEIDFETLKRLCDDSALLKRVLSDKESPKKTFAHVLGGCDSLLTMQLGLHIVALVSIVNSKKNGKFRLAVHRPSAET